MLIVLVATAQKARGPISASGSSWTWHEGNIGCLNIALSYMVLASQPLLHFFHFHSQQQQEVWIYFNVRPHIHDDGPGDPKVSGSISKSWLPSVCVTVHRREWICMVTYACIHCWCFFQCKLFFFKKSCSSSGITMKEERKDNRNPGISDFIISFASPFSTREESNGPWLQLL